VGINVSKETLAVLVTKGPMNAAEAAELGKGAGAGIKGGGAATIEGGIPTLREVNISSGAKGNWSKELNNPQPNRIYKVDEVNVYQTDSLSRVTKVESDLSLMKQDRNTYQQCKAGKCGVSGDEGGHLIASILNGSGEKLNLVPMNANLNRGAWKSMENTWASALKDGQSVRFMIDPIYEGASVRPGSFNVTYSIGGARPVRVNFANAPGG